MKIFYCLIILFLVESFFDCPLFAMERTSCSEANAQPLQWEEEVLEEIGEDLQDPFWTDFMDIPFDKEVDSSATSLARSLDKEVNSSAASCARLLDKEVDSFAASCARLLDKEANSSAASCARSLCWDGDLSMFIAGINKQECYYVNFYGARDSEFSSRDLPYHRFNINRNSKRSVHQYLFLLMENRRNVVSLEKIDELSLLNICGHGFNKNKRVRPNVLKVCVNPYHYERSWTFPG